MNMSLITIEKDLWEDDLEGVITAWLFDDGDSVAAGDVVAEVMVEKAQYEIAAGDSGALSIRVAVEVPVKPGDVIAELR